MDSSLIQFFVTLGWTSLVVLIYGTGWFVFALVKQRNDSADIAWGSYFVVTSVTMFLLSAPALDMRLVVMGIVMVWALRLMTHIAKRFVHSPEEDPRYRAWRTAWGTGWYFNVRTFLQVFLLQILLSIVVAAPALIIMHFGVIADGWFFLGLGIWLIGFIIESVADKQLKRFLATPHEPDAIMDTGLWAYSRHPNYFGEVMQWWGIFTIGLGGLYGIWGIIGPITITGLIVFVSGIPLAEARLLTNPKFIEYQKRTSPLVPLPRRLTRIAAPKTLAAMLIEFGPLLLFFVTFELFDFFTSVIILVVAVAIALFSSIRLYRRIALFPIISTGSVILFGVLTVIYHNPFFIIFKDTLYFGIFGLLIIIPYLARRILILKNMFGQIFAITEQGWIIVSMNWAVCMLLIALSNEFARKFLSADEWVTYKMIVLVGLIVFSGVQLIIARKTRLPEASSWGLRI